jgi:hypothetical protein
VNLDRIPKPTDLMDHPQLAAIVALETTLVVSMRALLAVHTDLLDDVFPRCVAEVDYWADRMINLGCELQNAIEKYRRKLLESDFSGEPDF